MNPAAPGNGPPLDRAPFAAKFGAKIDSVEAARIALLAYLEAWSLEARQLNRIEVVLEELVSNVVRHGGRATFVEIKAACRNGAVMLAVEDDGAAFNPLEQAEPARFDKLENAALGGLGIGLVKRLTHSVDYAREGERNRVTVTFAA